MKRSLLLFIICIILSCTVHAQSKIGIPSIKNFSPDEYNAGNEITTIQQDKNGLLYFANNEGLVTFDGSFWKIYPMPHKGAIKSLAIDTKGRIFVGGQDEIGYFFPDEYGILKYHSLKNLMPSKGRQFADIWNIVLYNDEVFFRTIESIFRLKNNKISTFDATGGWRLLTKAGSQLFAEDSVHGLMFFKDNQWQPYAGQPNTAAFRITGIMDYKKDTLLVTTLRKGFFLLSGSSLTAKPTDIDALLYNDQVNCTRKIAEDRYAIGTTAKGLIIIDGNGKLIDQFSTNEGLQHNNILSLLLDRDQNLWLGLEDGLDFIHYHTAVKHIYPGNKNRIKSNAINVFDGKLFIGTSNGLYSTPLNFQHKDFSDSRGIFTEVKNTKGQVWSLSTVNNHLLMGHQDGAFTVIDNLARPVAAEQHGTWRFQPVPFSNDIIAGTYTGLQLLKSMEGSFKDEGKIDGLYESLANLVLDEHHFIWSSHPYRGIYKIELSADRKKIISYVNYTKKTGLPSLLNNRVSFIRKKIVVATEKGVYSYSGQQHKFIPDDFYRPIFGNAAVEYLTEDTLGNIWFVSNQHVGVIDFSKKNGAVQYTIIYIPELDGQTIKGAEYIYPYDPENIFVSSTNGVFHLNYQKYIKSAAHELNILITAVKITGEKDSLIFGGYFMKNNRPGTAQDPGQVLSLAHQYNSFHFEYSSTLFAEKSNEEFSYKLIGYDKEWSKWSVKTEKDYTNLPDGKYTFSVRSRNHLGNAAQPVNYTFIITPAWYQTIWAYLFYFACFLCIFYAVLKLQRRKFDLRQQKQEEEQQKLNYLHSLELDIHEKEIIALKNDKLEAELHYKNKELATVTMHLVDRGRQFLTIKEELLVLVDKLNIPDQSHLFKSLFKLLSDTEKVDEDWNHFSIHFDQVHNNFLATIKAKYPKLSATDLKLCAYLRLNLTSKEIAQLLNISVKGVEVSRYRVRKKLQLSSDINLYDFLIEVTQNN